MKLKKSLAKYNPFYTTQVTSETIQGQPKKWNVQSDRSSSGDLPITICRPGYYDEKIISQLLTKDDKSSQKKTLANLHFSLYSQSTSVTWK